MLTITPQLKAALRAGKASAHGGRAAFNQIQIEIGANGHFVMTLLCDGMPVLAEERIVLPADVFTMSGIDGSFEIVLS